MSFSILEILGLKKRRPPLTTEETNEPQRKPVESDADPLGADNPDGFGGEGDGGGEGQ